MTGSIPVRGGLHFVALASFLLTLHDGWRF
nr:MAG TPA: hypothetical protein [Caudoviricetes sp.]